VRDIALFVSEIPERMHRGVCVLLVACFVWLLVAGGGCSGCISGAICVRYAVYGLRCAVSMGVVRADGWMPLDGRMNGGIGIGIVEGRARAREKSRKPISAYRPQPLPPSPCPCQREDKGMRDLPRVGRAGRERRKRGDGDEEGEAERKSKTCPRTSG
jgi:hypothetical protein